MAFLISGAGLPAFLAQEVGGGGDGIRFAIEIHAAVAAAVHAVVQCVAGQKLRVAQLTMFRAFGVWRDSAPIHQFQRADRMGYEKVRAAAVIGQRRDGRDDSTIAHETAKAVSIPWIAKRTPAGTP